MPFLMVAKAIPPLFSISPHNIQHAKHCFGFQKSEFPPSKLHLKSRILPSRMHTMLTPVIETEECRRNEWNKKICELCKEGYLREAMDLVSTSQRFKLHLSTYCTVLQLCAELNSLQDGKQVHAIIRSNGVPIDGLLGCKLVFMYVTCGELSEGRRVFDEFPNEKVFLWSLMMNEYAKIGAYNVSLDLFEKMLNFGIEANAHSLTCVLKSCAALGSVREGEWVHGYLLKLDFGSCNIIVNSLMTFYGKIGRVESARKLFDELRDRDIISWNSMISGYVANGFPEEGLEVFKEMIYMGINLDFATAGSVLQACGGCNDLSLGRVVHALAVKACFDRETIFGNTLLDMYAKCGELDDAQQVFESMKEKSIVSWTSMIAGYAKGGQSDVAIRLFREMEREGIRPEIFSVTAVLHACACNGSLETGRDVHNYVKENDMQSNIFVCNALMDMYAKCGSMREAHSVFIEMPVKDIISWNTMIGGYSKNGFPNEALGLFASMMKQLKPDSTTVACILPACASLAALDKGREIHAYILRRTYLSALQVANALADMYVKCGVLVLAKLLFDRIPKKDLVSWTVMIAGYGMHGYGKQAIATFKEMRTTGIKPDEVSFVSILYACSHSGLLDEGWRFFNTMQKDFNIEPTLEHYACIVDLLARTGKLSRAYKFIKSMPTQPDATIWGALLSGCRIHHNVTLAEKVAEHVFELEPENTGYYVLLANIYAEAEKWEEVRKLRQKIGQQGLKKNPGCSWMEVRGRVRIFLAGDNSHPELKKVESFVEQLRLRMEEEGHFPKLRYALINADVAEKEMALCGHSEKLAMAFGMLNLPPGRTIRVTKNLRVCGDCHEMAKFMSKISGREILLRDSNRFHHFKDGTCCCRGFW